WTKSGWSPSTVNVNKCAVLALYDVDNNTYNTHRYAVQFNAMVKRQELKVVKNTPVDITPVLSLFRTWGSNESLPLEDLVSKDCLALGIAPKDKTGGSSFETTVITSPTQDLLICPVNAYTSYLARLPKDLIALPHHKPTRLSPRPDCIPLFQIRTQTISAHSGVHHRSQAEGHHASYEPPCRLHRSQVSRDR
ncbi:hypothetical protein BGZ96_000382, partial [Linnemannia gamsii]